MGRQELWNALRHRISEWSSDAARDVPAGGDAGASRLDARLLELAFRDSDAAVITFDSAGRIHSVSRGVGAALGYSEADLAGRDAAALFAEPESFRNLSEAARATAFVKNWEAVLARKDGGKSRLSLALQLVRDVAGGSDGGKGGESRAGELGGCLRLEPLEPALDDAGTEGLREALMRVERFSSLGRMTAAFAHDMRSPLHLIASTAEFLLEQSGGKGADPKARESLEVIVRHSRHASAAIKALLDFARVGRCVLAEGRLDDTVVGALDLLRKECETRGIRTSLELRPTSPILLDPNHLRAGVYNVMVNAVDAMPKGGALTIGTEPAEAGRVARLTVADTGVGMPPEVLGRISKPFFSTKTSGLGLGLYLTKRILAEHGARIIFSSAPGKGTTAILEFPAAKQPGEK